MTTGSIPRGADPRPQPIEALRGAARLLAVHPGLSVGLGVALVLSLGSVCCGLGLIAAPWFACELLALTLATGLGRRVPRQRGWLAAGAVQAVAVVVLSAAVGAAVTWLGAETPRSSEMPAPVAPSNARLLALALGGSVLGLLYMVPYIYAPLLLVDRGGGLGAAMAESARYVVRGGFVAHLGLSLASHLLQVSPPLLAAVIALVAGDLGEIAWGVALAVPVMAVTVPLGQGMIVASYLDRRPSGATAALGRAPLTRPLAAGLFAVGLAPAVALLLVSAAVTVRPADPRPGEAPLGEVVAGGTIDGAPVALAIPHTALEVRASPTRLAIAAGDGGGAGAVPRPEGAVFERVRVVRVRDAYALEVAGEGRSWVTWIDRAGVRLDDDLSARLADRLPTWGLPWLAVAMMAAALGIAPTLAWLGSRSEANRCRAWTVVLALLPLAAVALWLGARALLL
ncbi:MAG: hypothetical protein ACODAU_06775 [Myxococcota bacterium]